MVPHLLPPLIYGTLVTGQLARAKEFKWIGFAFNDDDDDDGAVQLYKLLLPRLRSNDMLNYYYVDGLRRVTNLTWTGIT